MPAPRILVIDVSNSFTKLAVAHRGKLGRIRRIPTPKLSATRLREAVRGLRFDATIFGSVVPARNVAIRRALKAPVLELTHASNLGIGIDYPNPAGIGADRLANAVGCRALYGAPAIVVDFGTAVTFDVLSAEGNYIGGVIAPGLSAMTSYLHERTALLPAIEIAEPKRAVGRTTREAMLSGAVHGYRGLIREIVQKVREEAFPRHRPKIVATGGNAAMLAKGLPIFTAVDPELTLHGLRLVAERSL